MLPLHVNLIPEKNRLSGTGAWKELLEVQVSDALTLYLTPNPTSIVFDGRTYSPFAAELDAAKADALGGLPTFTINLQVVTRELIVYLEEHDITGRPVTLSIVHEANLADPTAVAVQEQYEITSVQVIGDVFAKFTCGHDRLLTHVVSARRAYRDACGWDYQDPVTCGYAGALPTCSKRLEGSNGCRAHGNQERIGSFPTLVTNAS